MHAGTIAGVDDAHVGLALRRIRLQRRLRQSDLSRIAGLSATSISLIERGHIDRTALDRLRAVAAALDARIDVVVRWRGGDLDRLVSRRHAGMAERIAALLVDAGWDVLPEFSFSHYGERGVVDLVAWHPGTRMLLIVEVKTELVDVHELLSTTDRRRRIVPRLVAERGWDPAAVSTWVVIAESRTNRRRVGEHATLLRAAFPLDGRQVRGWVVDPRVACHTLWFLSDSRGAEAGRGSSPTKRVRREPRSVPKPRNPAR